MFEKGVCEEIINDDSLTLVLSNDIIDAYVEGVYNNKLSVKMPKLYIDKTSNNKDIFNFNHKFVIHRLHDDIEKQTFYILYLYATNIQNYDPDFVRFIQDAAKNPRYHYNIYVSDYIYQKRTFANITKSRLIQIGDEVIFKVNLDQPISSEHLMNRDYRTKLNLIEIVSLLSDYRDELNTIDQEG